MLKSRRTAVQAALLAFSLMLSLVAFSIPATAVPVPVLDPECGTSVNPPGRNYAPPKNAPTPQGSYFAYPNRSAAERVAIRNRVIDMIDSTWGTYYTPNTVTQDKCTDSTTTPPTPRTDYRYTASYTPHTGSVRLATWSFNDWGVRDAVVRAVNRGTRVQAIAAYGINAQSQYKPWFSTRDYLNSHRSSPAWGQKPELVNSATECSGACRGRGGTPHSKYYLFDDVGASHFHSATIQTSMNLTAFAFGGQWNAAQVFWNTPVYNRFMSIFDQSLPKNRSYAYQSTNDGGVINSFFPGGSLSKDTALQVLNGVRCTNAGSGGVGGRTRVRVIQYALYDTRGVALAKRMRYLWNSGCDVRIIYSVTSRPVLKILRSPSGRGRVPMKQSVIKNGAGEIVKYNHSKWLAVAGNYGGRPGTWTVLTGSANWSNFAYGCDEAMQQTFGAGWVSPFFGAFDTTWAQQTSRPPTYGGSLSGARLGARQAGPTFGFGIYKYMETD